VDLDSGGKQKSVMKIDLTLKNLTVAGPPGDLACKVANVIAKRAAEAAEVVKGKLDDAECEKAVVVELDDGSGPWCFLEGSKAKQDEFVCGCQVLNGLTPVGGRKASKDAAKDKKTGSKTETKGKNAKQTKADEEKAEDFDEEEEAAEDEADDEELEASKLNASVGEDDDLAASQPEKTSPKGKKDKTKKDKKGDKEKTKKTPAEKPPPPPPPLEEEEEEEEVEEGSEE